MDSRKDKDSGLIVDLTLGLVDALGTFPGIRDVNVGLRPGAEKATISAWEQRHGVTLPQTLKQIYSATDGFSLTWNYSVAGKTVPLGNLEIHPLARLSRVVSGRSSGDPLLPSLSDILLADDSTSQQNQHPEDVSQDTHSINKKKTKEPSPPSFHISKLFEIDNLKGYGRVVLAYPGRGECFAEGSFWFIDLSLKFHLLATDALTYWRLLLVYLGMPQWQAHIVGLNLTPWARQWYELLTPHLLDSSSRQCRSSQPELINKLDWSVFKTKKVVKKQSKDTQKQNKETTDKDKNKSTKDK